MINKQLINLSSPATSGGLTEAESGLILHLDANDVDSYDGDGSVWYDITNHEYKPATNVSEHFNTVLYDTTGSTASITGVGFEPELVWIKRTDGGGSNYLFDQVRGVHKALISEQTYAEIDKTSYLTSFDSDGFSLGTNSALIGAGNSYVAWCFKAGGTAIANTDGSIASSVSINTDLGFSITKYNGNATSGATVGHGLGVKPELIIVKNLDAAVSWGVWTTGIGLTEVLRLNQDTAATTPATAYFTPQNNTGSVFGLGTNDETNDGSDDYIAYCFASKRGVSKVGSYTGTGAAGNKVYTGFEPAWLMVKESSSTGNWRIMDNVRDTGNVKDLGLWANLSNAQSASSSNTVSFNRDGFTLQGDGSDVNTTNQTYIYLAFAKDTNFDDLIDDTDLELHLDAASFPQKGESGYSNTPSTWTALTGSNATISGATFDSELGNYLNFDGSGDKVITAQTFNSTNDFTAELWVKRDTNGERLLFKSGGTHPNAYYLIFQPSLGFYYRDYSSGAITYTGLAAAPINEWLHVCVVNVFGSPPKIYVNGVHENASTTSGSSTGTSGTDPFKIGEQFTAALWYDWSGYIGQVRMYSSALTQDQVRQNFNFTKNDYPNGINASLINVSWAADYFEIDSTSDVIEFGNGLKSYLDGLTTAISTSYWVRFDDLNATQVLLSYYNSSLGSASSSMVQWMRSSGKLSYYIAPSSGSTFADTSSVCVTANTWHHVVFILDMSKAQTNGTGGRVQVFVDGTEQSMSYNDSNGSTTMKTGSSSLKPAFGFSTNSSGVKENFFDGRVSKIKIYDKALTQAEVTALEAEGSGN